MYIISVQNYTDRRNEYINMNINKMLKLTWALMTVKL